MKNILIVILLCPLLALAQTPAKSFTIEGKLEKFPEGLTIHLYKNGENREIASDTLRKGKFMLKGKIAEPVLCFMIIGTGKPIEIFVESGKMSFKGDNEEPEKFKISGSSSHKDFQEFSGKFVPVVQQHKFPRGGSSPGLMVCHWMQLVNVNRGRQSECADTARRAGQDSHGCWRPG